MLPPSAPIETKNDALGVPAPRRSDRARTDHDYHCLANPNARRPGARHEANTAKLNREAFTGTIYHVLHGDLGLHDAPTTLEEAKSRSDWPKWEEAMNEEIATLRKMNTWELTHLPSDRKPISCRWVYALKRNAQGDIVHYKARLVARGFSQEFGIHYCETFAPVIRLDALQLILAVAVIKGWDMQQLDIKSA